jgi:hypothetical protein
VWFDLARNVVLPAGTERVYTGVVAAPRELGAVLRRQCMAPWQ